MPNLSAKAKLKRINAIKELGDCAAIGMQTLDNGTDGFLKTEVLASDIRVARLISARRELIRDLTQGVNHYVQKALYENEAMVKGLTAEGISARLHTTAGLSEFNIGVDFSSYDSS